MTTAETGHLADRDAVELAAMVRRGDVSCREVVGAHLDRLDERDPLVNAVPVRRDPDAVLAEADARDAAAVAARAAGAPLGALHGLPIAVKDLAEVAGLAWTAGSPVHAARVGAVDDPFVARMRAAGAIVVGKTNTPELGYGSQTVNPVHGPTRNPYDRTRTIGGSSGGAAAALAARMLPLADGSDYLGSLRNPAAFGNVLGLRPSVGRVPRPGFVAQLGEIGPMGRSVADVALLLSVLAGPDPAAPLSRTDDPAAFADPSGDGVADGDLTGLRVAWVGDLDGRLACEPEVLRVGRAAVEVCAALGAEVVETVPRFDLDALWDATLTWRAWNALTLADLPADAFALLKPDIRGEVERGLALSALDVHRAACVRAEWAACTAELFTGVDAVLAPSTQVLPFDVDTLWPRTVAGRPMDSYLRWMETVAPWSMAGTPVLGMPAGFAAGGLPVGVQLIGPVGADAAVLRWGAAYERATQWTRRHPPILVPPGR